ncbi:hypothetical protein BX600DRAFT_464434 [Xylariales sp. PMI_506]|nr:hypothetical protein BX600DRAFT_464434 [Xylariales sp. PMI_506]
MHPKRLREFAYGPPELVRHLLPPVFYFDYTSYTSPDRFLDLLELTKPCHATDPRDKVFALLGLLPSGRIGTLGADYNLSLEQVYTQVALYLAAHVGWSAVLARAGRSRYSYLEQDKLDVLPSWVPNWSITQRDDSWRSLSLAKHKTSGDKWELLQHNDANNSLSLRLLRISAPFDQWYTWDEHMAALIGSYLCFPADGDMGIIAQARYDRFCGQYDHRKLWTRSTLPIGRFPVKPLSLRLERVVDMEDQYYLDSFDYNEEPTIQLLCVSIDAAAQIFTLRPNDPDLEDLERAVISANRSWPRNQNRRINLKVNIATHDAGPSELESFWKSKYTAGELEIVNSIVDDGDSIMFEDTDSVIFGDELGEDGEIANSPVDEADNIMVGDINAVRGHDELVGLNVDLWKFLVRWYMLRDNLIEII